jgi:hypothetical protein
LLELTVRRWKLSNLPLFVPGRTTRSVRTNVAVAKSSEMSGVYLFPVARRMAGGIFSNMFVGFLYATSSTHYPPVDIATT